MENELKLKFILIPSQFLQNEEVQKKYHKSIYLSHTFHELYCGFLPYLPGSQKKNTIHHLGKEWRIQVNGAIPIFFH